MAERGEDVPSDTIARVREVAEYIRISKERMLALESGVRALRDKTRNDLQVAQSRIEAEAARADSAEQRCRELETRLSELDVVIRQELLAAVDNEADRPRAGLRLVQPALESDSEPVNSPSDVGEPPSRRRVVLDEM
jgi:hypothetical protein